MHAWVPRSQNGLFACRSEEETEDAKQGMVSPASEQPMGSWADAAVEGGAASIVAEAVQAAEPVASAFAVEGPCAEFNNAASAQQALESVPCSNAAMEKSRYMIGTFQLLASSLLQVSARQGIRC